MTDKPVEEQKNPEKKIGQREQYTEAARDVLRRFESFRQFMVVCAQCQVEAPVDWHFCSNCGNRLSTECPSCGQPLPPAGGRFCPHCGLMIPRIEPAKPDSG